MFLPNIRSLLINKYANCKRIKKYVSCKPIDIFDLKYCCHNYCIFFMQKLSKTTQNKQIK